MQNYMLTIPRERTDRIGTEPIIRLMRYIRENDVKKWIVAMETGKGGYEHWQVRLQAREGFSEWKDAEVPVLGPNWTIVMEKTKVGTGWIQRNIPQAHVEECSDKWEYETKEGRYWASWDTVEVHRLRWGRMKWWQEAIVNRVRATNDREVVVWYDPKGNNGKSWLVGHLFETGKAYYLPPTMTTVQGMLQTMASLAHQDREDGRPPKEFVVIDLPRTWKWSKELYCAIESIKDGLIMDPRYSARPINIRGVKVLVLTNEMPKLDALSEDRWIIEKTPMH